ncbi:proline--tRNA ligase [Paenibacillus sp. CCS19]|uniref:proline--tRNA ligase n=1 Tax=Paenibacillus sp. CCS19 TaxID=3158387 RepID=UPI00255E287A|nr:proline--tRNA ligase [Paenibacillus cellulosilyticus]GMK40459.1 proline--tRNA ligase [Paenibacillus cellulosilyticus]
MRQNQLLLSTLRESPGDAEAISHQLMLRAGYIRQVAAGIYTYMPLGRRVLRKVEEIVREEMDRAGAQELLMPALQPAELWKESGRYGVYGPELMRLQDRHEREFALGPTHEEVITTLVRNEISSYRRLPVTLYQIQTKFRDERRPRFGLLRGREFLMKDAYSFDTDWEGLDASYQQMYKAYHRIFERCGLNFRAVEADAGAIGGEGGTHEFMALADIGEDTIAACTCCGYAANLEKATSRASAGEDSHAHDQAKASTPAIEKFHTPSIRTIDQLVQSVGAAASDILKTVVFVADEQVVAVVVRGDHEINELKVKHYLGAEDIAIADAETVLRLTGVPTGFIGPVGLTLKVLVDHAAAALTNGIAGANEGDYHYRNVQPGRDFELTHTGDFRNAAEGDGCPNCADGTLQFYRGIEVGHVFKLGTKYSEKLGAQFLDSAGKSQTMIMGCYGIGVSRVLSAVVEQHYDANGIIWPMGIAPYQVHLIPIAVKDEAQMQAALELYERLQANGVEVLLDDRDERPGVKFKDSDLIGIPLRIVVGRDIASGQVEYVERRAGEKQVIGTEEAIERVLAAVRGR